MNERVDDGGVVRAGPIKVDVIGEVDTMEKLIAFVTRATWKGHVAEGVQDVSDKRAKALCNNLTRAGHGAMTEFGYIVFDIRNVSRSLTHQLVRHRMANYSQESQHYIDYDTITVVEPHGLTEEQEDLFYTACRESLWNYQALIDTGIDFYIARQVLPNATASRICVGMNARSLYNFFAIRCCHRNTPEIKELAWVMLDVCRTHWPNLFARAGPSCWQLGFCPEGMKSCGRYNIEVRSYGDIAKRMDIGWELREYGREPF